MTAHKSKIDPMTLSVVWHALISIAEEMGTALWRTAFSAAVREAHDFSTGIFDAEGQLVAQGNFTPGHLGSMPYAVRNIMPYFPREELMPGDTILMNDSFLASGHYPDLWLVTPAFQDGRVIGFVATCAHHVDVGGSAPGSQLVVGVTEAFQEGIRVLPVKLVRAGELETDLERMLLGNVRFPDKVRGDLLAQLNANHLGIRRLVALWETYGHEQTAAVLAEILDRSEAAIREAITAIPDGNYSFTDQLDDVGPGTDPVTVHVTVTVDGDSIVVDFTGSSPAVAAGINSYINYTRAYALFAVKVFTVPLLPQNQSLLRAVEIVAEEGSFFNPKYPAPSGGRAGVQVRIFDAINGALAPAAPNRAIAAFSHWANPNIGGADDGSGKPFVMYDLIMGGYGGSAARDGSEALSPVFNGRNIPIEVHEAENPIVVRCLELIPDSGGAGRHRGGCAVRKDIELRAPHATLTHLTDRHRFPPYGIDGGAPGALGETILMRDGEEHRVPSKGRVELYAGDVVSFRTAGAGGYGDPRERSAEAVRRDLHEGFVTADHAEQTYGVSAQGAPATSIGNNGGHQK